MSTKDNAHKFLKNNNSGVIATISLEGRPNTSAIYYQVEDEKSLYFMTKSSTTKYVNILTNNHVSLCVYDESARIAVQVDGRAFEVKQQNEQIQAMKQLAKVRKDGENYWLPPISHLKDGKFVVVRVEIDDLTLADFSHHKPQEKHGVIEKVKL